MTQQEALAEAQRRWGVRYGTIFVDLPLHLGEPIQYEVGVNSLHREVSGDGWRDIWFTGDTWEAAFADADAKGAQ